MGACCRALPLRIDLDRPDLFHARLYFGQVFSAAGDGGDEFLRALPLHDLVRRAGADLVDIDGDGFGDGALRSGDAACDQLVAVGGLDAFIDGTALAAGGEDKGEQEDSEFAHAANVAIRRGFAKANRAFGVLKLTKITDTGGCECQLCRFSEGGFGTG